ncbi:MAG: phosphoribosylamine--glycine ligase [Planctomycetes bacterium]|nr:phosphoribosylamine--glycine ligase [Planctomycetota bacterium]
MKVLVVGGGGREHALCWKIALSPLVKRVYCAPGNGGIAGVAECVDVAANDVAGLVRFAKAEAIDLTVVGPEEPLCLGLVDAMRAASLRVLGPDQSAAEIEGSKAYAREVCRRNRIPSPGFWVFNDSSKAHAFLENRQEGPIVVKASGLAAGKGVTMARTRAEARTAVDEMMDQARFGAAGRTVVLEEFLEGSECSVIHLTDGKTFAPFEPARDHKRVFDRDQGPNTGGMGAVSPVPGLGKRTLRQIEDQILFPAVNGLNREGRVFRGFLYAGCMLTATGPRLLEFNCRLGDPETQPILMRLSSDLVPLLLHAADGTLEQCEAPVFDSRTAVCVVAASGGYPGEYQKGCLIHGLDQVRGGPDLQVFHSGTARRGGDLVTTGGRVLSVCALGKSVEEARSRAYTELAKIEFQGIHYRRDIGA